VKTPPTNVDLSTDGAFRRSTACQKKDGYEDSTHSFGLRHRERIGWLVDVPV